MNLFDNKNTATGDVPAPPNDTPIVVAAFYKFTPISEPEVLRGPLATQCAKAKIYGTLLIAPEGLNGTVAGDYMGVCQLMSWLRKQDGFEDVQPKYSFAEAQAFHRMKVRLKKEIVTMGQPDIDPRNCVGRYVAPNEWDALIKDPDTVVIDTRNHYEVAIGTFEGAINPQTESFRDFPEWIDNYLENLPDDKKPKNIAMFCTGGIRCEKSTSYLVSRGYQNVFHLEGGILKYLETMPEDQSSWAGDCFVFDQRVSVRHGLAQGDYDLCHACRMPITAEDKQSSLFTPGLSCPKCHDKITADQRLRFGERQKQIELARARGEAHLGGAAPSTKRHV